MAGLATALQLSRHILGARSAVGSIDGQEVLTLDRQAALKLGK